MMFNISGRPEHQPIKAIIPSIYMTIEAYTYIMECVSQCPYEISWFSRVLELDDSETSRHSYLIEDVIIPKQSVFPSTVEFSEKELSTFMTDTIKEKGLEFYNDIKCWGHSHANMQASPSGQDLDQILKFKDQDYYIMLIINKKGDAYVAFYDFKNNTQYKNIPIHLYCANGRNISEEVKGIIKERVKFPKEQKVNYAYGRCGMETFLVGDTDYQNGVVNSLTMYATKIYDYFSNVVNSNYAYRDTMDMINQASKNINPVLKYANSDATIKSAKNIKIYKDALFAAEKVGLLKSTAKIKGDMEDYDNWFLNRIDIMLSSKDSCKARECLSLIFANMPIEFDVRNIANKDGLIGEIELKSWLQDLEMLKKDEVNSLCATLKSVQRESILSYNDILDSLYEEWCDSMEEELEDDRDDMLDLKEELED